VYSVPWKIAVSSASGDDDMASWVVQCSNCQSHFTHSEIPDEGFPSLSLPDKPQFPAGGSELKCPHCGHTDTYQRTDLLYRS
jgi:hypothetical protein